MSARQNGSSLVGPSRPSESMSSISNTLMAGQLQIAVAKLQLRSVEQQGKDALSLIQSAAPAANAPPANAAADVGTALNIVG
jgi:hypothetical protein